MNRHGIIALAIGAAIVGTVGYRCSHAVPARLLDNATDDRPELRELVRSLGAYRPLEPRLTGGFAYGAISASLSQSLAAPQLNPDTRIALATIEKKAAASGSESDWAALGTAYLVAGDLDKGLKLLEAAVATPVPNPLWLTDLSAAYLAVARSHNRQELLPKALATAEKATRRNSRLREAVFNKALALEAICLTEQAEAQWTAYRAIDRDSAWSDEALVHLTRLKDERNATLTRWDDVERDLAGGSQESHIDVKILKLVRNRLRAWIDASLLPAWGELELQGARPTADDQLARARAAADLLAASGGDQMPRDGIRAIDRARNSRSGRTVQALARAHIAFRDAIRRSEHDDVAGADASFQTAAQGFAAARSPYALWGPIYHGIALYAVRRFEDARATLTAGGTVDLDTRYRYLGGRRKWLTGLILANEGPLMASLADYRAAYEAFQTIGESDAEASVAALSAEVLTMLGATAEAWRYELAALGHATRLVSSPGKRLLLLKAGGLLCLNDQPEAALHFQNAVISLSSSLESERPSALVEGYFYRAQILHRIGDGTAAREDLGRARIQLLRIVDTSIRRRQEAELLLAEAFILRTVAPEDAIRSATRAIEFLGDSGGQSRMTELHLARGRAHLAAGERDRAEEDFHAAIRHFEKQRNQMLDRQFRASFFHDGWFAFAEMARVQVVSRKDAASGLDYAERGRARTLLEGATGTQAVEPLAAESVQHRLPDHTAALFFMTLDDRLLIWTVTAARVTAVDRPVSVAALRGRVDRMRWLIGQSNSEASHLTVDLESLFMELIGPIWSELSDVRTLAIVPDGPLHAVPFAALINPKTGRYLVQDFVVMSAPSLSVLVRSEHGHAESSAPARRALVIGNPAHKRAVDEAPLPQLPFSADESAVVAKTYPQSLLLTRQDATKRAVLENLSRFDIVHFAGHAIVNEQTPSLSRLLMATTGALDDGTLFVSELADIRMDSVKLVVLAACSTLSGAVANGEGIASIARPFLESGASMVVGTLWDVQDRAAAELFQRLHRLVSDGTPPALALVLVQRRLIEDATLNMRAPAQWAWAVSIGKLP